MMTTLTEHRTRWTAIAPSKMLRWLPIGALGLDLALAAAAAMAASLGRARLPFLSTPDDLAETLGVAGPLIVLGWMVCLALGGAYDRDVFGAGTDEYKRILNSSLMAAGLVGVGSYLVKFELSRGFFVLLFGLGVPLLLAGRLVVRRGLYTLRTRGVLCHRVIIAGSGTHIDEIGSVLHRDTWLGYQIVGALTPDHELSEETAAGIPVLGNASDATAIVTESGADIILFASGALSSATELRRIVWDLEQHDVQVIVAPNVTDISNERVRVRPIGGLPLVHIEPPKWRDASRWGKRAFDLAASSALILALAPAFAFCALSIWRADRGPILFRQQRIGRDSKKFGCFKFRTMVVDAEARVAELQAQLGQSALLFKMKDDPRITKPGKWLRRFSLDELPQLFNVWRGEMSLIGPRPQVQREVELYDHAMSRRLHVRPGMTGLWQVSGRNDLTPEEAIRLDLYYVDNWSMMQDVSILARTVGAVLGRRGAY